MRTISNLLHFTVYFLLLESGFSCLNGEVRLASGSAPNEGRVEVCNGNSYGTVCDDHWDSNDASVVCHQLGYSRQGVQHPHIIIDLIIVWL